MTISPGRSTTCRCCRLGSACSAPIRLWRGRSGRKRKAAERERQREEKEMREPQLGVAISRRWRELNPAGVNADRAGHTGSHGGALSR
jgi:hypothetical protein